MANIIVIEEAENNSGLIQDITKFISQKVNGRCTCLEVNQLENTKKLLSFPGLNIDLEQYIVRRNDKVIPLTFYEFQALACLAGQPGRVFTKEQLYNIVYGDAKIVNVDNSIYCLVRDIRKKLKTDEKNYEYIQTVRKVGYKFIIPEA